LLALASHPILDIFTGYTPIFWPLYSYSIWLQVAGMVHLSVHSLQTFSLYWQMLIKPIYFQTFESLDAPLFTGEGLILSVMLIVSLLFSARTRITSRVQQILQGALRNVLTTLA